MPIVIFRQYQVQVGFRVPNLKTKNKGTHLIDFGCFADLVAAFGTVDKKQDSYGTKQDESGTK